MPAEAAAACRERASFTVEAVEERERVTDHDVAAFVDVVAASVGEQGRWIHYGLTSSDVLDTALAPAARRGRARSSSSGATAYRDALVARALEHARDAVRRAHPRRPRRADHLRAAARRLRVRGRPQPRAACADAFEQAAVGKLSGAVGTYASIPPAVEARGDGRGSGCAPRTSRPRSSPATATPSCSQAIALAGAGLERFAQEIRNLQRTEVREVEEPFASGAQKGSSAMPHKRNPITAERICGLARVLRGYAQAGLENVALWHERDISHSGAERVILPDATILLDYMQHLAVRVVEGMTVHAERMRENLELTHGALFSQRALTALIESGMTRDDAYRLVQEAAQQAWDTRDAVPRAARASGRRTSTSTTVLDPDAYLAHVPEVLARLDRLGA